MPNSHCPCDFADARTARLCYSPHGLPDPPSNSVTTPSRSTRVSTRHRHYHPFIRPGSPDQFGPASDQRRQLSFQFDDLHGSHRVPENTKLSPSKRIEFFWANNCEPYTENNNEKAILADRLTSAFLEQISESAPHVRVPACVLHVKLRLPAIVCRGADHCDRQYSPERDRDRQLG